VEKGPVANLHLDLSNPRLHAELGFSNGVTEQQMEERIWQQADTKALYQQILGDGGLIEMPFVRPDDIVAEGNRRLVCLRKLLQSAEVPDAIKANIRDIYFCRIPQAASDLDVKKLLLDWHVSTKKGWLKPDQMEVLWQLYQAGTTVDELARRTRENKDSMQNRLDAYDLLLKHRARIAAEGGTITAPKAQSNLLSHYRQIMRDETLRAWIESDEANHKTFDDLVANRQIKEVKDTRDRLPTILASPEGLELLTDDEMTVRNAYDRISSSGSIFEEIEAWTLKLQTIPLRDVSDLATNRTKMRRLTNLETAITDLKAQAVRMQQPQPAGANA